MRQWARSESGNPLETLYSYNDAGDLSGVDYSDGTADVSYTYNRRGQQASLAQSGGLTTAFTFNDAGAVLTESCSGVVLNGLSACR